MDIDFLDLGIFLQFSYIFSPSRTAIVPPIYFFAKKMPCILHCNAKKIRDTISSQVSGRAQLPGVIIYIVDQESNTAMSGGHTPTICSHPNEHDHDEDDHHMSRLFIRQLGRRSHILSLLFHSNNNNSGFQIQ